MRKSEEMKVTGEIVGGFTHKIRSPLAAMKLSIEVLLEELTLKEDERAVLLKVIEEIKRIEVLMKKFLDYARPTASNLMSLNLNKIIEETAKFLEKSPSFSPVSRRLIVQDLAPDIPGTTGDPQELQRMFLNIFLNAGEAMSEGGTLTIRTAKDEDTKTIRVTISDTGHGIPAEAAERIFQPFFSTKVKGAGLGLTVAKRIIEEHGGSITLQTNSPAGTAFELILPVR